MADWFKTHCDMLDNDGMMPAALLTSKHALAVWVYLMCRACKLRSRTFELTKQNRLAAAHTLGIQFADFEAGQRALAKNDDKKPTVTLGPGDRITLNYMDQHQSEYWARIEAKKEREEKYNVRNTSSPDSVGTHSGHTRDTVPRTPVQSIKRVREEKKSRDRNSENFRARGADKKEITTAVERDKTRGNNKTTGKDAKNGRAPAAPKGTGGSGKLTETERREAVKRWPDLNKKIKQCLGRDKHEMFIAPARCLGVGRARVVLEVGAGMAARFKSGDGVRAAATVRACVGDMLGDMGHPPELVIVEAAVGAPGKKRVGGFGRASADDAKR